ncbi:cytochrome c oxidase assembly protein [Maritimibacter dapengensis]|uniref:Cytochrome c oxidase assembly protein n=1 Tax=Maritimibacter dapengensis TaxID=2836868 RepID=A0ABS6SYF0_9RHOB|nr:cytochrome c oxidase assembly protein [Maritimibacter dapengensis]MBV7377995.1 cytochrome c oxidase assembly protein [Maritimibacter dapengensis]
MTRPIFATLAALTLAIAWIPDWEAHQGDFPAHMLRHMILVAISAPLLVAALPILTRLTLPIALAAAIEFAVVWGFHLPGVHAATQAGGAAFVLEQALFLAAGCVIWASALAPENPLAGAGGMLLTSMHMTLLGALLVLATDDLYAEICGRAPDLGGQQLGGLLMLAIGTPIYLVAGLTLTAKVLKERPT